jgi:hypothetical protein
VTPTKGFNPHFDLDLKFGQEQENELQKIFDSERIEVKTDRVCKRTGNLYVEYQSRGKESGIKTTKAHYWAFCLWTEDKKKYSWVIIPTIKLKRLIRKNKYRSVSGGDRNSSWGWLVPKVDLIEFI